MSDNMISAEQVRELEYLLRAKESSIMSLREELRETKHLYDEAQGYMERMNFHYDVLEKKNAEL